jgi:hypothetical protein
MRTKPSTPGEGRGDVVDPLALRLSSRQRVEEILGEAKLDERGQSLGRIVPHGRRCENAGEGLVLDHRDGVRSKTDAAGYGQRIRRLSRLEHMPPLPTRVAP